jgi:hypothetical protein
LKLRRLKLPSFLLLFFSRITNSVARCASCILSLPNLGLWSVSSLSFFRAFIYALVLYFFHCAFCCCLYWVVGNWGILRIGLALLGCPGSFGVYALFNHHFIQFIVLFQFVNFLWGEVYQDEPVNGLTMVCLFILNFLLVSQIY